MLESINNLGKDEKFKDNFSNKDFRRNVYTLFSFNLAHRNFYVQKKINVKSF